MYELSKEERELIKAWNLSQEEIVNITYIESATKDDESIENFLSILTKTASNLNIQKKKKAENSLPEIVIADNIKYSAIPLSNELKPFLKALSFKKHGNNGKVFSEKIIANLKKINIPVQLKLFAAQTCPHCPIVVDDMLGMAYENKYIELSIIDPTIFTEQATSNSVLSVPCLILDDNFRWTGSVSMEDVTDVLANRDPSTLKASNLRRILEDGKASWLTEQMIEKHMIFPEFIKLVIHQIWSVRLGAMVVIEELAEINIEFANKICPFLWETFSKAPVDVKGDILYAIGEAGTIEDMDLIGKELAHIEMAELQEAAQDAMEAIKLRL